MQQWTRQWNTRSNGKVEWWFRTCKWEWVAVAKRGMRASWWRAGFNWVWIACQAAADCVLRGGDSRRSIGFWLWKSQNKTSQKEEQSSISKPFFRERVLLRCRRVTRRLRGFLWSQRMWGLNCKVLGVPNKGEGLNGVLCWWTWTRRVRIMYCHALAM